MQYTKYLENKNLSNNTIITYLKMNNNFNNYIGEKKINKTNIINCIKDYQSKHSANSTKLFYNSIISYLKYLKQDKLINELKDIKLPCSSKMRRRLVNIEQFNSLKSIECKTFIQKRNWIIFCLLFTTGIRANEISQIKINGIFNNQIKITGKGNKERVVYICDYMLETLSNWPYDQVNIKSSGVPLTYKQINLIIKSFTTKYIGYEMKPHDIRSSYATHLLKSGVNIKIVSELLGHNNIQTTSHYLHYSIDEIHDEITRSFN
ncbi:MAG: tyrosine-type recombinase/integrase [Mycoplasma sp.]